MKTTLDPENVRPATARGESTQFVDSSALLNQPEELRARAQKDGYLFFKGLLPKEDVYAVRRDLLAVTDNYGWRKPGQSPDGGEMDLDALNQVPDVEMRDDIGVSIAAYKDAQKVESMHRLPHHPRLLGLFKLLFQDDVLVHARHIARMVTSHRMMVPTPPHQDFPLIQGTSNTWTAWIPLGDCPRTMGGLTVLRGSHQLGYVPIQASKGAGGIAAQTCPWETDWVETDYEAGDVLIFPSYTIHKALRCQQREFIRLSLDVRYQSVHEPIEEGSLRPHTELDWEEVYAGWKQDDLKYYWKKHDLKLIPRDDSYLQPKRRIC
jgi:Phytanoyl-CoA dioxygenase (PhyH)